MASAKLANSTVNQSHRAICNTKATDSPCALAKNNSTVVTRAPTSVTNMTGFLIMWRGLSFLKLSQTAGTMISGSNRERWRAFSDGSYAGCGRDGVIVLVMNSFQRSPRILKQQSGAYYMSWFERMGPKSRLSRDSVFVRASDALVKCRVGFMACAAGVLAARHRRKVPAAQTIATSPSGHAPC